MSSTAASCIEYIDFGNLDPISINQARWVYVPIKDPDFVTNEPRGSAYNPSNYEILIFGGARNQCFHMDVSSLMNISHGQDKQGWIQKSITPNTFNIARGPNDKLLCESRFCQDSDFIVRTFGNYLYAVDGALGNLHVYSIKEKQWNYSKLKDLGM